MSDTKRAGWTAGPWTPSTVKGDEVVHSSEGDCIAWCNGIRVDNRANARLIAAAPELMEASRLTLRNLKSMISFFPLDLAHAQEIELQSLKTWAATVDAAIAKAEGQVQP